MARSKCAFRQRDVTRAIKAARAADVDIARIEILDGKIVIIPNNSADPDDLDQELSQFQVRNGQA